MTTATLYPPPATTATEPLSVLHVSMCLRTGGLERLLVEMARHGDASRVSPRFAALAELGPPAEELRSLGARVDSVGFSAGPVGKARTVWRLARLIRRERPHVVHAHNTYAQFYAALAARLAGRLPGGHRAKVVCTQHGRGAGPNDRAIRQFRIANRSTDVVLGVSEDAARLCREQDPDHAAIIRCLWNGVDVARFAYHGPADGCRLVAVSRLSPEKDVATLLKAVAIARAEIPQLHLTIVGDGAERPRLESLAGELAITDCVDFLGERSDVPDQLAAGSLFVSSSLTEGISLTFLEAMGVGLPVLATAVGGNPEVIVTADASPGPNVMPGGDGSDQAGRSGQTGALVPSDDPEQFAAALRQMWANRSQWDEWGRNGRRRVETQFSLARMLDDYATLYEQLVHGTDR